MADFWNNKSSGENGNNDKLDLLIMSKAPSSSSSFFSISATNSPLDNSARLPAFKSPYLPYPGTRSRWSDCSRSFLKHYETEKNNSSDCDFAGFIGWLSSSTKNTERKDQLPPRPPKEAGRQHHLVLPWIPEEKEIGATSNQGKELVLPRSENGNKVVVTVKEDLLKDLQARFKDKEASKTATQLNEIPNDGSEEARKRRRTLSNKLSASRTRNMKAQYVIGLEEQVKSLEENIVLLKPQNVFHEEKQRMLMAESQLLQCQISTCQDFITLETLQIEANQEEIERLREVEKQLVEFVSAEQMLRAPTVTVTTLAPPNYWLLNQQEASGSMMMADDPAFTTGDDDLNGFDPAQFLAPTADEEATTSNMVPDHNS